MTPADLSLRPLRRADAEALVDMAGEFHTAGDPRLDAALRDVNAYFAAAEQAAAGRDLPENRVQQTHFLLFRGARLLGGARLRHRLIPLLHRDGGNIGYEIRPSERGRGYGSVILTCMLAEARAIGLERVLLTTSAVNTASIRVIERNGGVADGTAVSHVTGEVMRRYWIRLPGGA